MKRTVPILLAALLMVSCSSRLQIAQDGSWHRLTHGDRIMFVSAGPDSLLSYSDSVPVAYSYKVQRSRLILTNGSEKLKLKARRLKLEPYIEPEFAPSDLTIYREPCFRVDVENDLRYGSAMGYWTSLPGVEADVMKVFTQGYVKSFSQKNLDLTLDLYTPSDQKGKHPLILFIHGGAFYVGDKQEPAYVDLCRHFASMGYVTASMNYRMGFHVGKSDIERAGYAAAQDAHAAMRWLVAKADSLGIDRDRLYVAGSSAGSMTALNMTFMKDRQRPESTRGEKHLVRADEEDMGPIDGSSNTIRQTFHIRALANMWGAVSTLSMLENSNTAIISFHGDSDEIVPFDEGYAFSMAGKLIAKRLSAVMYGSKAIHANALRIGLKSEFHPYAGQGHAFNTTGPDKTPNEFHYEIRSDMGRFFFEDLVGGTAAIEQTGEGRYRVVGPVAADMTWKADGGFVVSARKNEVHVLWRAGQPHSLQVTGHYTAGPGYHLRY